MEASGICRSQALKLNSELNILLTVVVIPLWRQCVPAGNSAATDATPHAATTGYFRLRQAISQAP